VKVGDLVSYAGRSDQYVGIITATKTFDTFCTRHRVEWQQQGIYRNIWHNAKNLELLSESR
jgi:hypothetical protein